jgi:hypothetical protein
MDKVQKYTSINAKSSETYKSDCNDLREIGWDVVAQDTEQQWTLVYTVMNLGEPQNARISLLSDY